MNRTFLLILMVPLLPLAGAFWNRAAAMVFAGLAWAALLGGLLNFSDSPFLWLFLAQLPLMGVLTFVSIRISGNSSDVPLEDEVGKSASLLKSLKSQHLVLKEEVARAEREESQSLQIYGAAKGLAEALSWKDMAPRLTASIQKVFGGYEFLLFAYDEKGARTLLHRRGGWSRDFPIDDDIALEPVFVHPPQTSEVVPVLSVPVYSGEGDNRRMNGVLILKSPAGKWEEEELINTGRAFGEQLGMALDKALLFAQMEQHSRVDGLTHVLRRQAFMDRMNEEFKRAAVFQTPFSLMMIDIDHFKAVNDSRGHAAGDAVLTRLGETLKGGVYETDVVARYGGEEFIILMPKAQPDGAMRKAEQLRQTIENDVVTFGFERLKLTVSIGVSHYPTSAATADDLIAAADKAMYQAKESGRNRVVEG